MVIFTDGEDTTSIVHGRSLDDILKSAVDNKIPLYFVRTNYDKEFGEGIPDAKWQAAVEKTGGRYYVVRERSQPARGDRRHRSRSRRRDPRDPLHEPAAAFTLFALAAAACWATAAGLKLGLARFQHLP